MKRLGIQVLTVAASAVLARPPLACGGRPPGRLAASLKLYSSRILVGEPLVLTVRVANVGQGDVKTAYAVPGVFRNTGNIKLRIRKEKDLVFTRQAHSSGAAVARLRDDLWPTRWRLSAGDSLSTEKTVCLLGKAPDGQYQWLQPGQYRVQVVVSLQGHKEQLLTDEQELQINPLSDKQAPALGMLRLPLDTLIEGYWGRPTQEMIKAGDRLRKEFPNLPHRQYLAFALLAQYETADTYRPAAAAYLKEFPDSPYRDNALLRLAQLERDARQWHRAIATLKSMLEGYPESPLRKDAQALLGVVELKAKPGRKPVGTEPTSSAPKPGDRHPPAETAVTK